MARQMNAWSAIFLIAAALRTYMEGTGRCRATFEHPRHGPAVQEKLEQTWRNTGFRNFYDDDGEAIPEVMGLGWDEGDRLIIESLLTPVKEAAYAARVESWYRRRAKQAVTSSLDASLD